MSVPGRRHPRVESAADPTPGSALLTRGRTRVWPFDHGSVLVHWSLWRRPDFESMLHRLATGAFCGVGT